MEGSLLKSSFNQITFHCVVFCIEPQCVHINIPEQKSLLTIEWSGWTWIEKNFQRSKEVFIKFDAY